MSIPPPTPVITPAQRLPLSFRGPDGWPEPSSDWLAANQGWEPPVGWVPLPGLAPAPAGWSWWRRDEVGWAAMTGAITARYTRGVIIDALVFVVGAVLTIVPATLHLGIGFVFWGAVVFGPVSLARTLGGLRRARRAFDSFTRSRAAEIRHALARVAYARHAAEAGSAALPFEAFLARRWSEAWSFTGSWPADQAHAGVAEQYRIPDDPRLSRRHRAATLVFAVVAGGLLVVIAVDASAASQAGSGASSAAFGNGAATGGAVSTATAGPRLAGPATPIQAGSARPVDAMVLNADSASAARCRSSARCFVVRIDSSGSCTAASVVVEFSASPDAASADSHETLAVVLTGSDYTDVAVDERAAGDGYAVVATASCTGG